MAVVEFRVEEDEESSDELAVDLYVDGIALRELVRMLEEPQAQVDPHGGTPGDYVGIGVWVLWERPGYFLGLAPASEAASTILLGCGCGTPECHPLHARIGLDGDRVSWSHFRPARPAWNLADLGPFVFERAQYEDSLDAACQLARTRYGR